MKKREIFINLSVKNLDKSKEFFSKLGFSFNLDFTDENAACMLIEENIFSMLITEKFFNTFIPGRKITDTKKDVEVLNAFSVNSRNEVDEMIKKVIKAGGNEYRTVSDYGWMYSRSFEDLDKHIWEVMYIDETKIPKKK